MNTFRVIRHIDCLPVYRYMPRRWAASIVLLASLTGCAALGGLGSADDEHAALPSGPVRTIVMVWDGMRPDQINRSDTPNLYRLRRAGAHFTDHHAAFPTLSMVNAATLATGTYPKAHGVLGTMQWIPALGTFKVLPRGDNAAGEAQDYVNPFFTEDHQVVATLNKFYDFRLLLVKSLFATAQEAGLVTAVIGKSGAAYLQDLGQGGLFIDENTVAPHGLALELQQKGFPLPANTVKSYSDAQTIALSQTNGAPSRRAGFITFDTTAYDPAGQITVAARDAADTTQGAPEDAANRYLLSLFTDYVLPVKQPMLSLIWMRTPDQPGHGYGPGSANYKAALRSQDRRLGELLAALREKGMDKSTNLVIVSDHGQSSVSGPLDQYPLRAIVPSPTRPDGPTINGASSGKSRASIGKADRRGYSFSGDVRTADLLTYRGFVAYDGVGCETDPMLGLNAQGVPNVAVRIDADGSLCGEPNRAYQAISATLPHPVASFYVPPPESLPPNAIVVVSNGGSESFYVPNHDRQVVRRLVQFLQKREEYGAIFVDRRYGTLPGTLLMEQIRFQSPGREDKGQPDVLVSFNWDDKTEIQGVPGIEFASFSPGQRGIHGSFSPVDVQSVLIAHGPSFRPQQIDSPSGNVDVAPTVAHVLGLSLPHADGRVLKEALREETGTPMPTWTSSVIQPANPSQGLRFERASDPTGATEGSARNGYYSFDLAVKDLTMDGKVYRYFDYARTIRQ